MVTKKQLDYKDYTVGWATVLASELNAARLLLDEEHEDLSPKEKDDNNYVLGRMGVHNVVISFTGAGVYGTNAAAQMVTNMLRTFPNIRFGLLVGVGGGVPQLPDSQDSAKDIRLGDVVVSEPKGVHGGVIQYDMGKWKNDGDFVVESHLNKPPPMLLKALKRLMSDQMVGKGEMKNYVGKALTEAAAIPSMKGCRYPGRNQDRLFQTDYKHTGGEDCSACNSEMAVRRLNRDSDVPEVHYGLIASANAVMKSAVHRDKLRDTWQMACFEMEAAGLMDTFPCLVIRGICDYSDDHKNKIWQPYAGVTAAAYARDLLRVIRAEEVQSIPPAAEVINNPGTGSGAPAGTGTGGGSVSLQEFNQLRESLARIEDQLRTLIRQTGQQNPPVQNPPVQNPPTPVQNPPPPSPIPNPPPQSPNQQPPGSTMLPYQERIGHFLKSEIDAALRRDRTIFERDLRALTSRIGQTDNYWVPWITDINVFKDTWKITEPQMYNKWMSGTLHRNLWQLRRLNRALSGQQRYFAICNEFTGWLNHQSPWGGETGECSVEHHLWSLWRVMEYMGIAEAAAVKID